MLSFFDKLKAASDILLDAEKEVEIANIDLPKAEASGILIAARHLVERVLSYNPGNHADTVLHDFDS